MLEHTEIAVATYMANVAKANGVADTGKKKFTVSPAIQQKIVTRLRLTSSFLSMVNVTLVAAQEGEKLGVGATRPIAGRTNTNTPGNRRIATDPTSTTRLNTYRCEKTDSDYAFKYDKLDSWAHIPEFEKLLQEAVLTQQGIDKIMIAFNGTHVAADTDKDTYPLLQDVNVGWIQQLRTDAPERIISYGEKDPQTKDAGGNVTHTGSIIVKADGTGDYVNLDALVTDMKQLLDERTRTATDLVVILGANLAGKRTFTLVSSAGNDAEKALALDVLRGKDTIGGLPSMQVPYFPANAIMITSLKNLSIYLQIGSQRRMLRDEPDYDQLANYESFNEDYVIEDYGKIAFAENIDLEGDGEIANVPEEEGEGA
ncbi:phage major capsid protein, P2 family [Sphingomonas oryzagri]|uniref:Phage major capsid protein, P2 family n=1 Tax=Sphingomonas oryzagri TaxID=3042314 RepID=A0ABT6N7V3_9SPHN|nr:phage major capsid protein, P2 family [Sphingomonas oryzagri]MDH7641184.1 phage major capsid protein, P2 family [Sphingomonas oryzagri]